MQQVLERPKTNIRFEKIIISSCFQDVDNYFKAKNRGISAEEFQDLEYKEIWNKMEKVAVDTGISPLVINEEFKFSSDSVREENLRKLEELENSRVNPADLELSINKLREFSGVRALVRLAGHINESVSAGINVEDILSKVTSELFSINTDSENIQEYNAFESVNETSKELKKRMAGEVADGVPSGISTLDAEIRCFYYALATIVIGRPGHGKTTLMANTFVNNLRDDYKPVFISLEMPAIHLVLKMLAIWTKVKINKLFDPRQLTEEEKERVKKALYELAQKEFYIVDAVSMTVNDFGMIMLKYAKLGCKVAYLDYIQLLKMANGQIPNDAAEFRAVFKQVREILRRVNRYGDLACVLGAQAGRTVEQRPIEERIPQMKDLEWSSSLEQDAAVIIGIMNREKYEGEECEYKNQVFLGFPKHRYENAIRVNLAFMGDIQYMADLASPERYENVPERWVREVEREESKREEEQQRVENSRWTQDTVIEEIHLLHRDNNSLDESSVHEHFNPLHTAAIRFFGSWGEAIMQSGIFAQVES